MVITAAGSSIKRLGPDGIVLLFGLLAAGLFAYKNSYFIHNDAFITLRYAVNFANTGSPQWNIGESVEGYTSLMHLSLEAALIRLGLSPVGSIYVVNFAALTAVMTLCTFAARSIHPSALAARALVVGAVAAAPPLAIWAQGGLETVLVAAFLLGGVVCLLVNLKDPRAYITALAALAFSCAILTRLDCAVFIAGCGLGYSLAASGRLRQRLTIAALVVGVPAAVSLIQMAIRHSVYGELFPLTFYAKTDFSLPARVNSGLIYVLQSLRDAALVWGAGLVFFWASLLHKRTPASTLLAIPILAHVCYVIWAGGDHMPAARFFLPLIAPSALLILALVAGLPSRTGIAVTGACAAIVLVTAVQRPSEPMDKAAFVGSIVGPYMDETWPRNITIALNSAGATPYYAAKYRRFIDMLGLNDPIIAKRKNTPIRKAIQRLPGHAKGDGAYVLSRKPDRIIIGPTEGTSIENAWFLSGTEMNELPAFHQCYTKHLEMIPFDETFAKRGAAYPNPLPFTYYVRTCDE